jgi:TRAP-type C4-dicarboxylate transport system permease small subunit
MRQVSLKAFQWLDQKYGFFAKMVALLAGLIMLIVTGITLKEVASRNLGMVSHWSNEMCLILVLWMFLLPVAYSQMTGGMIRITFFIDKLPRKLQPWLHMLGSLSAVIFGLIFIQASLSYLGRVTPGSYFMITHFPTVIERALIPVCASLLTIAAIICLGRDILTLRSRKPDWDSSVTEKGETS